MEGNVRYFIEPNELSYINAMWVAVTDDEIKQCLDLKRIEVTADVYATIGPDSQYIDGKVVQGEPQTPVLTPDAVASIRDSRIAYATTKISILTDSTDPDLVDEVDQADVALLKKWKQYRIALTKIDLNNPAWPEMPE